MAAKRFYTDVQLNQNQLQGFRIENLPTAPTGPAEGQPYYNTTTKQFLGWNGTAWVDLSQIITNPITIKGEIANANTTPAYPTSPAVGDAYFVTTTAGTIGTSAVETGDQLIYSTSGWVVLQRNLQAATQTLAGFVRLATQAEVNAGADLTTGISPATLAGFLANAQYTRKFRTVITSLAANTATTVTHGLNVVNMEDLHVQFYQGGGPVELAWTATSVNALTVTSNQALGNVTVVIEG